MDGQEPSDPRRDSGGQFSELVDVIRRHRILVGAIAIFGTFVTVIAALAVPPSYTATAQIVMDAGPRDPNSTRTTIFETVDPTVIDTAIAILTAEDHFRSVQASLYDQPVFQSKKPEETSVLRNSIGELRSWLRAFIGSIKSIFSKPDDPKADDVRPGIPSVGELRAHTTVNQERRSRIISVSYTDKNPEKAAVIANQFVNLHIEELKDRNRREAERLLTWLDQRLVAVKAEVRQAEERVQSFRIIHGTNSAEVDAELIAQTRRQLARARSEIAVREAAIDTSHNTGVTEQGTEDSNMPAPGPGSPSKLENERPQARLDDETEVVRSQASMLEEYLKSLQSGAADRLGSEAELRFLERQAASAAEHYNDLLRRKQEIAEEQDHSTVAAQILASARAPSRPSSINPVLFIPAGLIAFSAFGVAIAVFLERMDRTLRSERDVVDVLGVSCIGLVPDIPRVYRRRSARYLFDGVSSAYGQAIYSIVAATLQPASAVPMVILVTSSVPGEGKTTLATGFAACAARLGRRVLLIDRDLQDPGGTEAFKMVVDENASNHPPLGHTGAGPIGRIPDLECDYLPVRRTSADQPALAAAQKIVEICQRLRESYDCVIIDGLPTFTAEARVLSTVADKVIFAVRWGSTRREVADNALQQLRHSNRFESLANVYAVLTRVHLKQHARYRLGDMGEFLDKHQRQYSRSGLWS